MANGKSAGDLSSKGLARHHDEAPAEGLMLDATERLCSLVGFPAAAAARSVSLNMMYIWYLA